MFVCCGCFVLSSRGLCDELITHPEECYRLWCVIVCDLETSTMRRPWPTLGCSVTQKKKPVVSNVRIWTRYKSIINDRHNMKEISAVMKACYIWPQLLTCKAVQYPTSIHLCTLTKGRNPAGARGLSVLYRIVLLHLNLMWFLFHAVFSIIHI